MQSPLNDCSNIAKAIICVGLVFLIGCQEKLDTTVHGHANGHIIYSNDNKPTTEKIALGKRLFFEKALSLDSSTSCASCHKPDLAFADSLAVSPGVHGRLAKRNAPSIMNVAYFPHLMMEGGVKTLELQVLAPLEDSNEMAMPILRACERLNKDSSYRKLFDVAWSDSVTPFTLTRSIAAFERQLSSLSTDYDKFLDGDSSALSSQAKLGMSLFYSDKTKCSKCHGGTLFTNFRIENNGLAAEYEDNGLFRLTADDADMGKFKVPSLKHVILTAPYMHDGSIPKLEDVVDHYDEGGKAHKNKSPLIKPLHLSEAEKTQLVAFLKSI